MSDEKSLPKSAAEALTSGYKAVSSDTKPDSFSASPGVISRDCTTLNEGDLCFASASGKFVCYCKDGQCSDCYEEGE